MRMAEKHPKMETPITQRRIHRQHDHLPRRDGAGGWKHASRSPKLFPCRAVAFPPSCARVPLKLGLITQNHTASVNRRPPTPELQQPKRAGAAGQTAAALQVEDVPFGAGALIWGCAAQGAQRGGSRRGAGVGGHGAAPYRRHVGRGEREAASRRVARQQCPCVPSQEERVFVTRLEFSRRLRLRRPFALKQGASGGGDLDRARSPSLECRPAPNP